MTRRTMSVCALALALIAAAFAPTAASAWAPADQATIHPGVQTVHGRRPVHRQLRLPGRLATVYLGQAAHCSGTGGATETNGCDSGTLPLGTPVEIDGAVAAGNARLQLLADDAGERRDRPRHLRVQRPRAGPDRPGRRRQRQPLGPRLRRPDRPRRQPSASLGSTVYSYGNSSNCAFGVTKLSPKQGVRRPERRRRLEPHVVYTLTPGIPGDSGSGFLNEAARRSACSARCRSRRWPAPTASATCSESSPTRDANGGFPALQLVPGTEPFNADLLGAILGA